MTAFAVQDLPGKVALVTGGSNGFGASVSRRLAAAGAHVVVADVDEAAGKVVADEVGGLFVRTDVRELGDSKAAVAAAVEAYGGLDIAFLNAGVTTGCSLGDDFDPELYRRANAINLDGVVFGVVAALPALKARGGGAIIGTASLAGLTAMPMDPVYNANKHAVVGLFRGLGVAVQPDNISANALCPSFARTAIIGDIEEWLDSASVPILSVDEVTDTVMAILAGGRSGECWFVQPGRESQPFGFRNVPGPRTRDGASAPSAVAEKQVADGVSLKH